MQLDWVQRYNGPDEDSGNALAVDDSGNVYVTGGVQAGASFICTTIKYNKFGDSLWVRNYQRQGNNFNVGYDIVTDDSGNVYIAAAVFILKYDKSGNLIWERYENAVFSKISIDSLNYIYASGLSAGLIVTVKYHPLGNRVWKSLGIGAREVNDLILDKLNNVLITTVSASSGTDYDFTTIKYSSQNGNLIWKRTYDGPSPSPSYDYSYGVATDNKCNVYVTGASMDVSSIFNCFTIKYDSSGNVIWTKRIYPPSNAYDIEVDELQNSYIASRSNGYNYTTKLDTNGNILWSRTYPTSNVFAINRSVIILDSINNVYATANIDTISNTSYGVLKYDSDGNLIFLVAYGYNPIGFNYLNDMAIDRKGSVYLTGESNYAYGTVKFSQIITNISGNGILPTGYKLEQNYPNPFNPKTVISYQLAVISDVRLKVYDVLGNEVATLVNEKKEIGSYTVEFDGSNLSSGVYFYRMEVNGNVIDTKRMILLK